MSDTEDEAEETTAPEDPAADAYEHLVDLYCDVIGEEPPPDATPAELAVAIPRRADRGRH